MDSRYLEALRLMELEKAKGHLRASLQTYYQDERFEEHHKIINELIEKIDDYLR